MKQEHEMYSNHVELLLSIHFLTGEPDKTTGGEVQFEDRIISLFSWQNIIKYPIFLAEPERVLFKG